MLCYKNQTMICLCPPPSAPQYEPDLPFLKRPSPAYAPGPSPVLFLLSVLFHFPLLQLASPPFIKTALKCSQEVEDNYLSISLLSPTLLGCYMHEYILHFNSRVPWG